MQDLDMLVRLYDLPALQPFLDRVHEHGVEIRPARSYERDLVLGFIHEHFGPGWASEAEMAFHMHPISCLIAVSDGQPVGFACYECTCRGFFGPTGVAESQRGRGVGAALLVQALYAMKAMSYGYAVIGGAGPVDFYSRIVGATQIEGSAPGVYADSLKRDA